MQGGLHVISVIGLLVTKRKESIALVEKANIFMEESIVLRETLRQDKEALEVEKEKYNLDSCAREKACLGFGGQDC